MHLIKGPCEGCAHCGGWLADCWGGVWRYDRRVWCVRDGHGAGKGSVQVTPATGCAHWRRDLDPDDYPFAASVTPVVF